MAEYAGLTKAQLWQKARLKFTRQGYRVGYAAGYEQALQDTRRALKESA